MRRYLNGKGFVEVYNEGLLPANIPRSYDEQVSSHSVCASRGRAVRRNYAVPAGAQAYPFTMYDAKGYEELLFEPGNSLFVRMGYE